MRLIDADDLLAEYDRQHEGEPGKARKLIEDAHNVDAVEVVRCKDCVYWGNEETKVATEYQLFCVCDALKRRRKAENCMTNEDFFCAYGERRNDENEPLGT